MIEEDFTRDWCDAQLHGVVWENSGRDLVLNALQANDGSLRSVKFSWVHELAIRLDFGKIVAGMPLVWAAEFERLPSSEIRVLVDFGDVGENRFICSDADVL